jgi:hypothetical protein
VAVMIIAPLPLDEEHTRAEIARVVAYATPREHWYEPETLPSPRPPGADPRHVCRVGLYKCAFSITVTPHGTIRHLSMSGLFGPPPPEQGFAIADAFGFTGWPGGDEPGPGWVGGAHADEPGVVVLAERIDA